MKALDLVFELVRKFVPMKETEWAKLKDEAEKDTREWHPDSENKIKATYARLNDLWYVRLAIAISYIPLVRSISKYVNTKDDEEEAEEF